MQDSASMEIRVTAGFLRTLSCDDIREELAALALSERIERSPTPKGGDS